MCLLTCLVVECSAGDRQEPPARGASGAEYRAALTELPVSR